MCLIDSWSCRLFDFWIVEFVWDIWVPVDRFKEFDFILADNIARPWRNSVNKVSRLSLNDSLLGLDSGLMVDKVLSISGH